MNQAIQILYKCTCAPHERTITISAREPGEDIAAFMERVTLALSNDHTFRSPNCSSRTMTHVKIPIDGEGGPIGSAINPIALGGKTA